MNFNAVDVLGHVLAVGTNNARCAHGIVLKHEPGRMGE